MSAEQVSIVDFSQPAATSDFLPCPPLLLSHQAGWQNIHLARYRLPAWEIPEIASPQHTIILSRAQQPTLSEMIFEGKVRTLQHQRNIACISIIPADLPMSINWNQEIEFTHCYLDRTFVERVAYESVHPDRTEIDLTTIKLDPLIWQIGSSLTTVLETAPQHSRFYADSMATALAAHLLQFYATQKHVLRADPERLSPSALNLAIEYINAHLSEDISLVALAIELGVSQYYLCQSFKKSIGMTPHKYLIQQRIERSQQLLQQPDLTILDIAIACGFANSSHFAKCFRQQLGISPSQFRAI
jgi:AraC family transcriptional regulator